MASPADKRLLDLLEKWLTSLELHTKYSALDDDRYWRIQPWLEHQRPNRWLLDLAKQKTETLKSQVEDRVRAGDAQFSESLELMIFLANLVGSEHIERFIPMADAQNELPLTPAAVAAESTLTATREMPQLSADRIAQGSATPSAQVARAERKSGHGTRVHGTRAGAKTVAKSAAKSPAKPSAKSQASTRNTDAAAVSTPAGGPREQVVADAARLIQWGRQWFELPELIARMADRPALAEVRRILKENKSAIERTTGQD